MAWAWYCPGCKGYYKFLKNSGSCKLIVKKVFIEKGGRKMLSWKCKECGEVFGSTSPEDVCPKCKEGRSNCYKCKQSFSARNLKRIPDNLVVCISCYNKYYAACTGCHLVVLKENLKQVGRRSDMLMCSVCIGNYLICPACRRLVAKRDQGTKEGYCSGCCKVKLEVYPQLQSAGFHPVPEMFGKQGPWYGIELETDVADKPDLSVRSRHFDTENCLEDLKKLMKKEKGSFYVKTDGSLQSGLEIVSQPHSIERWDKQEWLAEVCQLVKDHGGASFNTETCGVHVHRNRDDLTDLQLSMLIVLFVRLQPYFERVAQRKENGFCKYAFFADKPGATGLNGKVIYKSVKDGTGAAKHKYQALNLLNISTIECRIFRGTLIVGSILAYIHFVHMLCEFVKDKGTVLGKLLRYSIQNLWEMVYEFMSIDPILKSYLDEKQITKKGDRAALKVVPVPREVEGYVVVETTSSTLVYN